MVRAPKSSDPATLGKSEFARRLGITPGRVSQLIGQGLPVERGRIPLAAGIAWVRANVARETPLPVTDRRPEPTEGDADDLVTARISKLNREIELLGIEIRKSEGALVSKDEVRRGLTSFSRLIRDKWINFPDRYGAEIAAAVGCEPKLLMAELGKYVRLQLDEIANAKPTLPGD